MSVESFIANQLLDDRYAILYDKAERNVQDIATKEQDAYQALVNSIQCKFGIPTSITSVRNMVKHILEQVKNYEYEKRKDNEPTEYSRSKHRNNPATSFEGHEQFSDYFNAELLASTDETRENEQCSARLGRFMAHRKTRCSTLSKITQPPKFVEKESYMKNNARDVHLLEKKIRKMEKSFQQQHKMLNENSDVNSHTYLILFEKFSKIDPEKDEDCMREIFSEISKYTDDEQL